MILFSLTGDLLVTLARKSDTGLYTCEVINEEGVDMASSFVSVLGKLLCRFAFKSQSQIKIPELDQSPWMSRLEF